MPKIIFTLILFSYGSVFGATLEGLDSNGKKITLDILEHLGHTRLNYEGQSMIGDRSGNFTRFNSIEVDSNGNSQVLEIWIGIFSKNSPKLLRQCKANHNAEISVRRISSVNGKHKDKTDYRCALLLPKN